MIHHLFSRLARNDVEAARQMIETLPSEPQKQVALNGVAKEWVKRDPVAAARFASRPDSSSDQPILSTVMEKWAQLDWNQAVDWAVTNLSDEQLLDQYPGMMAEAVEAADTTEASHILSSLLANGSLPESKLVNEAVATVGQHLLEQDPGKAVDWMTSLPPSARESAASAVADRWAREDPVGVSEWLGSLEPGTVRDAGIVKLIKYLDKDSERSMAWAEALSSSTLEEETIREIHERE